MRQRGRVGLGDRHHNRPVSQYQASTAASLGVAAKMAKLGSMGVVFALVGILLLVAAVRWIGGKVSGK